MHVYFKTSKKKTPIDPDTRFLEKYFHIHKQAVRKFALPDVWAFGRSILKLVLYLNLNIAL